MGTDAPPILIVDSSVLINFLRIDRIDLLSSSAAQVSITEHVVAEITAEYPDQLECLNGAIARGRLDVISIDDPKELAEIARLRRITNARLGIGECSAIVVAVARGFHIAMDDSAAIKHIRRTLPTLSVHTTKDLMVALVRSDALSVEEADSIATTWSAHHSFTLKIKSFRDLI